MKGGRLSKYLKELEEAGFILSFAPWEKERGLYYKVIDEYTLFYLAWIAPKSHNKIAKNIDDAYWEALLKTSAWKSWSGYAFESVCFKHISPIQKALHIPSGSEVSSWRYSPKKGSKTGGAQIDVIFNRPDGIINLCEIKCCQSPIIINKRYIAHALRQEKIYREVTKTTKHIIHSLITSGGLKETNHSKGIIATKVLLSDLFEE